MQSTNTLNFALIYNKDFYIKRNDNHHGHMIIGQCESTVLCALMAVSRPCGCYSWICGLFGACLIKTSVWPKKQAPRQWSLLSVAGGVFPKNNNCRTIG